MGKNNKLEETKQVLGVSSALGLALDDVARQDEAPDHDLVWSELLDIGGESVYSFLQTKRVYPFGVFVGIITTIFQIYSFSVFFNEAIVCFAEDPSCSLPDGGLLNSTAEEVQLSEGVTWGGIVMGFCIALTFLMPDFIRVSVFLGENWNRWVRVRV